MAGRPKDSLNKTPKRQGPCLKCRKPVKGWFCKRCRAENGRAYELPVHHYPKEMS